MAPKALGAVVNCPARLGDGQMTEGLVMQPSAFLLTFSRSRKVPFASCLKTEGPTSPLWAHEGRPTTLWAIKGTQVEPYTSRGWSGHVKHGSTPGTGCLWETALTGCLGAQGPPPRADSTLSVKWWLQHPAIPRPT